LCVKYAAKSSSFEYAKLVKNVNIITFHPAITDACFLKLFEDSVRSENLLTGRIKVLCDYEKVIKKFAYAGLIPFITLNIGSWIE